MSDDKRNAWRPPPSDAPIVQIPRNPVPRVLICPYCDHELALPYRFCGNCGQPVSKDQQSEIHKHLLTP